MPDKLYAARYDDFTVGGSSPAENWFDISELGVRWSIPGGVQRIELTVRASSRLDAYARYKDHLGHTIAIYDGTMHSYIGGQIYEVIPDGKHVTYIAAGPWKRTYDLLYFGAYFPATGDTDDIVMDILTDSVSIDSTDQTNIAASSVAIGGWQPGTTGMFPGDAIKELSAIGDSANNIMDFYFVDQPFTGTNMNAPLPYFKSRSLTATPDWIFSIEDLAPDGLTMARHIWDIKDSIYISYGRTSGADDGADNNTLVDSTKNFIALGVKPGDIVTNLTDNAAFSVVSVNVTILTFTDSASGTWNNGDLYSIKKHELTQVGADGAATSDYWNVHYQEDRPEMDVIQATQYRDQLYATYRDAQLQQAFVISAPTIKDGNGVKWPLWRPFMGDSFYFRADNLFIDEAVFTDSDDRANSFMAVAMDYTFSDNRLRIVPSTGDSRLDSMLNQANIINGQIVSTAAGYSPPKRPIPQSGGGPGFPTGGSSGGVEGFPT